MVTQGEAKGNWYHKGKMRGWASQGEDKGDGYHKGRIRGMGITRVG